MYIQITTRCNMKCAHCCGSYTEKGTDMSRDVFLAAVQEAEARGEFVTIGGGEPTLHPLFWDFIGLALAHEDSKGSVHVITNGSRKETALRLARLARTGAVGADLSRDKYHSVIDPLVVTAFTREDNNSWARDHNDLRGIRTVDSILNLGRAKLNSIGIEDGCSCNDLFVTPDGKLWACAHQDLQFGTIFDPDIPEFYSDSDQCSQKMLEVFEEAA